MEAAVFITICVGLLSFVRASDKLNSCTNSANSAERESKDFPYIGCYESACFKNTTSFTISSINECTGACKNESSTFAALESGDTCNCGEFNCMGQSDTKRCDDQCGIPCQGVPAPQRFCGGMGLIQVYQVLDNRNTADTKAGSDKAGLGLKMWLIRTIVIVGVVFIAVGFLICLSLGLAGRRKRRQDQRQRPGQQADLNQTSNVEMTSLNSRVRRCRQDNQYSFTDYRHLNPSNTCTGPTTPLAPVQLSSDNAYDHIASRGRIPAIAGNLKTPPRSPPFPHGHWKSGHNCQDGGDVCSGLSCSDIKNGADFSSRPNADQFDELNDEIASTSPSYFTLETSENQTKFEKDSHFQMGMQARRGNLEDIPSCSREKNDGDDSSLYTYATCSDQSLDSRFYRKPKEARCQDDDDYAVISDPQYQRKNHNR